METHVISIVSKGSMYIHIYKTEVVFTGATRSGLLIFQPSCNCFQGDNLYIKKKLSEPGLVVDTETGPI